MPKSKPTTVDEYIETAPKEAQAKLREIRAILKKSAPRARETLKRGSPVFEEALATCPSAADTAGVVCIILSPSAYIRVWHASIRGMSFNRPAWQVRRGADVNCQVFDAGPIQSA